MNKLEHKVEIDKIMRALQSAFNKMNSQHTDQRMLLNLDRGEPYLTIENSMFIFFEIEDNKNIINIEVINEEQDSTRKIKDFPIEKSFEACQYILNHYFNTRIMSQMEQEFYS